jgi:ABC-type phosphate transport system auxiliary subunit
MDLDRVRDQLKAAKRRQAALEGRPGDPALDTEVQVLTEQHASLNQLANAVADAAERLRLLDLRVDAAVARAATIALQPDAVEELGGVDRELAVVVEELDALQAGLETVRSMGS